MEIATGQDRRQFLGTLLTAAGTSAALTAPAASAASGETKVNVYERIGVQPLVNAAGILTILGGSLMLKEVKEAMEEASRHYVDLRELHEAAGALIARRIGVEAALVTSGAAAALLVGTAACVTKGDPEKIHRVPDITGMSTFLRNSLWRPLLPLLLILSMFSGVRAARFVRDAAVYNGEGFGVIRLDRLQVTAWFLR